MSGRHIEFIWNFIKNYSDVNNSWFIPEKNLQDEKDIDRFIDESPATQVYENKQD